MTVARKEAARRDWGLQQSRVQRKHTMFWTLRGDSIMRGASGADLLAIIVTIRAFHAHLVAYLDS